MKKLPAILIGLCLVVLVCPPLSRAKVKISKPRSKSANRIALSTPKPFTQQKTLPKSRQLPEIGDLTTLAGAGETEAGTVTSNHKVRLTQMPSDPARSRT